MAIVFVPWLYIKINDVITSCPGCIFYEKIKAHSHLLAKYEIMWVISFKNLSDGKYEALSMIYFLVQISIITL